MPYDWLYVVYSSGYSFLNILSAKLLSMIYILLDWVKLGFVKCFQTGNLTKSGREVLREEKFKNKNITFFINYATH